MDIFSILNKIKNTSKKTEKEKILQQNKDNNILKEILVATYDKIFINYFVRKIIPVNHIGYGNLNLIDDWRVLKENCLDKLSNRIVTGNAALELINKTMEKYDIDSQFIIERILKRDLGIGISEKIINKIFKDLIPTFDVALAKTYDEKTKKLVKFNGDFYASRKLDGCRCLVIKNGEEIKFFSRKGKEFFTLNNLKNDIRDFLNNYDNVVLDGEVCLCDERGNENFSKIMKEIRRKDHTIKNPRYFVFDMISLKEFKEKKSMIPFNERIDLLNGLCENNSVKILEQKELNEEKEFLKLLENVKKYNWEGLILRKKDSIYEGKRSKNLLKVKTFKDDEYKVKNMEFGPYTYTVPGQGQKTEQCLTAIVIEHKGFPISVGSGFTIDERKRFFKNPNLILNKVVTISYFEESVDKFGNLSLRFPTIKAIHGSRRDT